MQKIYKYDKNEVHLQLSHEEVGIIARSDRMFVAFDEKEHIAPFMDRPMVSKFIAKLHHHLHANNAGFFFIIADDFGTEKACESQLAIYSECLGIDKDIYGNFHVFASAMGNDDVADAWMLMTRKWTFSDRMDFSQLDGSYECFRTFFLEHSVEIENLK